MHDERIELQPAPVAFIPQVPHRPHDHAETNYELEGFNAISLRLNSFTQNEWSELRLSAARCLLGRDGWFMGGARGLSAGTGCARTGLQLQEICGIRLLRILLLLLEFRAAGEVLNKHLLEHLRLIKIRPILEL